MNNELKGYLLGFVGVVIFGLTLPATRIAVTSLDPVFVGLGRAVLAAAIGAACLLITRQRWPVRDEWTRLVAVASGVVIGFPLLSAIAMQTAPAAHGGVVLGTLPLATAVTAALFTGERPSAGFWACSVVGAAAVVAFALIDGGTELHAADTLLVLSVISAAVGYAIGGDLTRSLGGWQVISWALIIALPVTIPAALFTMPASIEFDSISPQIWWSFLYVAIFSQFLGFFAWNAGLALGGIAKVGQVQLLQTFVTLAGAALLVGERIDGITIGFAVFVVAVVALSRKMRVTQKA